MYIVTAKTFGDMEMAEAFFSLIGNSWEKLNMGTVIEDYLHITVKNCVLQ